MEKIIEKTEDKVIIETIYTSYDTNENLKARVTLLRVNDNDIQCIGYAYFDEEKEDWIDTEEKNDWLNDHQEYAQSLFS